MVKIRKFAQLLIISLLLGLISANISIPLKINEKHGIYMTVKYGQNKCQIDLVPQIDCVQSTIVQPYGTLDECGANFIDKIDYYTKKYEAQFYFGAKQSNISFQVPSIGVDVEYGTKELCFSPLFSDRYSNALAEIFEQGLITEERVYISLNKKQTDDGYAGQLDIGIPDLSKTKNQIVDLQVSRLYKRYYSALTNSFSYGKKELFTAHTVLFTIDTPALTVSLSTFIDMLDQFTQQGILFNFSFNSGKRPILYSIDLLEDITVGLLAQDGSVFNVTITPEQYTEPLGNEQYELLISYRDDQDGNMTFGYRIFQSYYIGFDMSQSQVLISEKNYQQNSQA
ncbi:transmembrane protein, putative (macronuclear) [Tetrahymena thermophila SB210]|uniref:Transmembrane protein, putative n=1 Tax=Tetrahymena thermophila (strain SB210) TaxID=312017 RepID=Q22UY1_TETTS|nr:transmembrane protein, putative [Tetrahymena thermophila SB210]EAR89167.1 transmembrane protein, putative [Tetrahymena thermophila SB210]|eukprot:XP_001009412.1 transmembrane protein, putative [Tetrahymena thermophila SB210]